MALSVGGGEMGDLLAKLTGGTLGILWILAGPLTYIINVFDTWSGNSPVAVKLLINITLDVILAAIWPATWLVWIVMELAGSVTPLTSVLGF